MPTSGGGGQHRGLRHPATGQPYWLGQPGWAWGSAILSFLEKDAVETTLIHRELRITDPLNQAARVAVINTYRCPSDIGRSTFVLPAGPIPAPSYNLNYSATEVATSNYAGVFGTVAMVQVCGGTGNCMGDDSLVFQRGFNFDAMTDGLSSTFLVGERRSLSYPSTWVGVLAGAAHAPGRVVAVASSPPNSSQGDMSNFSSFHRRGTNFLVTDGSVRLVPETIEQRAYLALCTRASGDLIGDFAAP